LMNVVATMLLFWACYRLIHEETGEELTPSQWFWLVLACTVGAIPATVQMGQTSVFIAAACAIAILGCRLQRTWMTAVGLVIASAKPQISGPLLLFVPWFEPRQRRATAIAIAIVALLFVYAAMVDTDLIHNLHAAIHSYSTTPENNPAKLIGLVPSLLRVGIRSPIAWILGVASLLAVLGFAAWLLKTSNQTLSHSIPGMLLLVFSAGLALPLHTYDLCCYTIGFAMVGTLKRSYQLMFLIPAVFLWRPGFLMTWGSHSLGSIAGANILMSTFAWLFLLLMVITTAIILNRERSTPAGV
jgi:hypothetical protein